ncbi:MAG: hypothetical protein ACFFER_05970 [Candidatus Thorarchaeota archaeon]
MSSKDKLVIAEKKPFTSESELELILYNNKDLLGDLIVFAKQATSGNRDDIPDLLTVDGDGKIFLIEIKNVHPKVEKILYQALRYARWIKENPVEIKYLWQKQKETNPEENLPEPDWNALDPGILLVAPSFDMAFVKTVLSTQGIQFRFMTIERYVLSNYEIVAVNHLEQLDEAFPESVGLPTTRGPYSWETYLEDATNKEHLDKAKVLHGEVLKMLQELELDWLQIQFNKYWISYKNGRKNVMCLYFENDSTPGLSFYIADEPKNLGVDLPDELLSQCYWDEEYREFCVPVVKSKISTSDLKPLFIAAKKFRT